MAYTQTDLDKLKKELAGAQKMVQYSDKRVEFRSVEEIERQIAIVGAELAATAPGFRRRRRTTILVHAGKGLR